MIGAVRAAGNRNPSSTRHDHGIGTVSYLELGVGYNTPVIVKYPFWSQTLKNPNATYACLNYGETFCPSAISDRSICIDGDIGDTLTRVIGMKRSK